jgi:hypothetical protein
MTADCLVCGQRDAGRLYACDDCIDLIRRRLRELETYALVLAVTLTPLRTGTSRRAPGYGSRSPARDDAIVMLDLRSRSGGEGPDDEDEPPRSILGGLAQIADWIREEQDVSRPSGPPILSREVGYLLGQISWCAGRQWVDELADDVHQLHVQARRLAGDAPPGPLGACIAVGCGGDVYAASLRTRDGREDGARCRACGREYSGLDLVRLQVAQEAS